MHIDPRLVQIFLEDTGEGTKHGEVWLALDCDEMLVCYDTHFRITFKTDSSDFWHWLNYYNDNLRSKWNG